MISCRAFKLSAATGPATALDLSTRCPKPESGAEGLRRLLDSPTRCGQTKLRWKIWTTAGTSMVELQHKFAPMRSIFCGLPLRLQAELVGFAFASTRVLNHLGDVSGQLGAGLPELGGQLALELLLLRDVEGIARA
eukprot:CAMPEP_0203996344 /NCGR_PEP_ID=MMETSP0360-20130528/12669_1 /ASSEMBLY_ACC=CAM_ASM_000342 /TAXON_ID=268821 /ORGANISM="Scrippsiella Hangoei, Strain SHTV-5" /LENGTH=135 /DNA_ID=CAMNT_0050937139 /DNA_START=104 /DNA_END=512 /DNA_ORIENTATION=+